MGEYPAVVSQGEKIWSRPDVIALRMRTVMERMGWYLMFLRAVRSRRNGGSGVEVGSESTMTTVTGDEGARDPQLRGEWSEGGAEAVKGAQIIENGVTHTDTNSCICVGLPFYRESNSGVSAVYFNFGRVSSLGVNRMLCSCCTLAAIIV